MTFIGLALLLLDLFCIVHAARHKKSVIWYLVIFALPGLGSAAYVLFEVLPSLKQTPKAKALFEETIWAVKSDTEKCSILENRHTLTPSIDNALLLAEEYRNQGRYDDAIALLQSRLSDPHQDEPLLLAAIAELFFLKKEYRETIAWFDRLRAANPQWYRSDSHLLLARALEKMGGCEEQALEEYEALILTFPGQEARARYALFLAKTGHEAKAHAVALEMAMMIERGDHRYQTEQKIWLDLVAPLL